MFIPHDHGNRSRQIGCKNIEINEKVNMQSVVDDMELGDLNND